MTTESIQEKAARLLVEGRVDADPAPARIFRVEGDTGPHTVIVSATYRDCDCARVWKGGVRDCSHIEAAIEWVLAEAAYNEGISSPRAARFPAYSAASSRRRADESRRADEVFERLGA